MWYVIIGGIILWVIYRYNKKKQSAPALTVSMHVDNSGWEEAKKQKASSLKTLKKSFKPAPDNETALADTLSTLAAFHENHGQSLSEIEVSVKSLNLPDDLIKLETALRKEINRFYKQRDDLKSKAVAIQLSYQHAQLQLQNPEHEWKNFAGLQKLQSNWKAEEYFNGLLILMTAFKGTFPNSSNAEKLSSDIERMFELWNSQNIARENFESQVKAYDTVKTASDKHFVILSIIEYLDRRYKFNPSFKDELIGWCLKDIDLYEDFLKSFHEHDLFTTAQQMDFYDNPGLKEKKLATISFDRVKKLKNYMVPRLNSYDVLSSIYEADGNTEKLQWLQNTGVKIGYIDGVAIEPPEEKAAFDHKAITQEIEVSKSGQKGKLAFLDSKGEACSTESAFKDHAEQQGWHVMRAEVSFWQAMFCLTFWDEVFEGMGEPSQGQDIPHDLFRGDDFYLNRQKVIDSRYEQIKSINLSEFINQQINRSEGTWTRLIYNGDQDMLAYAKSKIVQDFLQKIDPEIFAKIVYRIAQNPNENRSGVSDFIIWNDDELKMVEVKKVREQVRESQLNWLSWMIDENIPVEIVRVKAV
ncbi:VRR-NUC domain-containing protein [Kiloniella sp.]|uniref:VRR-NUC domain-containing protein n=1 Tax=Kiloniella sp. TaxID=1938587 RepID=UPI003B029E3C